MEVAFMGLRLVMVASGTDCPCENLAVTSAASSPTGSSVEYPVDRPRFFELAATSVGAVAVIGPLLVLLIRQFGSLGDRAIPCCDYAALELGTRAFLRGEQWVGLYSREGWRHPGPAPFLWDSLFRILPGGGFAEHQIAAVTLALIATGGLLFVLRTRLGTVTWVAGCLVLSTWLFQFDVGYFREPWNPIVAMSWVLIVATAFIALVSGGSLRWAVALVAAGSMAVQTHVGAGPIVVVALGCAAVLVWRRRTERTFRPSVFASAAVAVVLWALPVYDLVFGEHNLWYIFAGQGGDVPVKDFGLSGLIGGIVHILSLSPGPQGLHFGAASPFLPSEPVTVVQAVVAVIGIGLGALAVRSWRPRPFAAACAAIGLTGLVVTGVTLAVGSSAFLPYLLFPVIVLGPLVWLGGIINIAALIAKRNEVASRPVLHNVAGVVFLGVAMAFGLLSTLGLPTNSLVAQYSDADTQELVVQIQENCAKLPESPVVEVQDTVEWLNAISIAEAIDSCDTAEPPVFIGFTGFVAGPSYQAEQGAIPNVYVVAEGEIIFPARKIAGVGNTMIVVLIWDLP
jgi:hypothetical protein